MQSLIYLDNYRGFSEAQIPLKQVNFLVGENSTGKTSFLDLLETFFGPSFWLFEPSFGLGRRATRHFLDLVSVSSTDRSYFTLGVISVANKKGEKHQATLATFSNDEGRPILSSYSRVTETSEITIKLLKSASRKAKAPHVRKRDFPRGKGPMSAADFIALSVKVHREKTGLKKLRIPEQFENAPLFLQCQQLLSPERELGANLNIEIPFPFGSRLVTLAPIRTKPRRTYDEPQTAYSPEGEHTPYVIKKELSNKAQAEAFRNFLTRAGKQSGLFKSVRIKQFGRGALAPFELDILLGEHALSIDNVGYGVSQALPVLVEIFIRPKNTTFSIQQPEVHLHPKAQAMVGDFIAELARAEEKRFFVETHSDFTIDRFRLNVRGNKKETISGQILFFERTLSGNAVTSIEILPSGDLSKDQPRGYRDFFLKEQIALIS